METKIAELLFSNSTIATISLLFIITLITKKLSSKHNPPLPPGPKGLPLLGNLLSLDPERHVYFLNLALKYGPIVTVKLGLEIGIVITSPAIAKEILKDQDATFANWDVTVAAQEFAFNSPDILWAPYGPEWRRLKKVCVQEILSNESLDRVFDIRQKELRKMIKYLHGKAGQPVNVCEQTFLMLLNVLTRTIWGGTVKEGEERECVAAEFKQVTGEMLGLTGMVNLADFFPWLSIFDLQGIRKKMKVLTARFDEIFETAIEERLRNRGRNGGLEGNDFLQFLLNLIDEEDAEIQFTKNHLKAMLMDMILGGTKGVSDAVEFALANMMNKPEILKKVIQELETVVGKDNVIEETSINKLPYLHAVMNETLRLRSAPPLLTRHSPSKTCQVAGYTIPKGARVFINAWAIHRDPSIWENPLEFSPERFLSDGKRGYSRNNFNYFPFGSGRRICPGISMAERTFMYSLASLVHSFDWSVPIGNDLEKETPLVAIPTPRLSNSSLYD